METFATWSKAANIVKGGEDLSEECWMDDMISKHDESQLWKLLERANLADLSQFHKPDVCDEVPLYSRESDISFLAGDVPAKNEILLSFSLKFLKAIIAYESHDAPYFAAVTIWEADDGPILPRVFIWNDGIQRLYEKLELREVSSRFGKGIKKYLSKLAVTDPLQIAEDVATLPEMPRVFIGPAIPPYKCFVPLHSFHKRILSVKS